MTKRHGMPQTVSQCGHSDPPDVLTIFNTMVYLGEDDSFHELEEILKN